MRAGIFEYIECFYDPRSRHSSPGRTSPVEYEQAGTKGAVVVQRQTVRDTAVMPNPRVELEDWSLDDEILERFARWLARRYIRPAFPDEFVEVYKDPVDGVFEDAPMEVREHFSNVVSEIRISKSSVQGPPYNFTFLLLIMSSDELTEQEYEAAAYIQESLEAALIASPLVDSVQFSFRTFYETSMAEYFASDPIYLEHLTHEGEEQPKGAKPPPQA